MSVEEEMDAGRWTTVNTRFRYLREITAGDAAVARLHDAWKAERESWPETGPADLSKG